MFKFHVSLNIVIQTSDFQPLTVTVVAEFFS